MSDSNAVRYLADATDDRALSLRKIWDTKVREAFHPRTVFYDRQNTIAEYRNIGRAKSHQVIQFADLPDPANYRPGAEMLGQNYGFSEITLTIDDWVVDHHDIPMDQGAYIDWNPVSKIAARMASKLAENMDKKLAIIGVNAARTAAKTITVGSDTLTVHNGGNVVERTAASLAAAYPSTLTGSKTFQEDLAQQAQLMNEDNVPMEGRYAFIGPYMQRVLTRDDTLFSRDYQNGRSDFASRSIGKVEGFEIIPTNHLPSTSFGDLDLGGTPAIPLASKYQGDFTTATEGQPAALILCGASMGEAAIGIVTGGGLRTDMWYDPRRQTLFLYAAIHFGANVLSPYCAGEIRVDAA